MTRFRILLAVALLTGVVGCPHFATPRLLDPGSAELQKARAERFDPFPQNDAGPSTVSTRPPGFEHEYPEPERARFERAPNSSYLQGAPGMIPAYPPAAPPGFVPR